MAVIQYWLDLAFGTTSKMRRVLKFWAGTAVLYLVCIGFVSREVYVRATPQADGLFVICLGLVGVVSFYVLLRCNEKLGLKNWQLACSQAVFAILYDIALYAVLTPIRGGMLIGLPVIIVFCAFSLRPRQTVWLSGFAVVSLAGVAAYLHSYSPQLHPAYEETVYFLQATLGVVCVTVVTGQLSVLRYRLQQRNDEVVLAAATISKLAKTDELTALANRRYMKDMLAGMEVIHTEERNTTCLAVIDLDYFKSINDRFGHAAGDSVLQTFAVEATSALRPCDELARWGGEEFLLLMPNTTLEDAVGILKRVADKIRSMSIFDVPEQLVITFSAGVARCSAGEKIDDTIRRADRMMYAAKEGGRAKIIAERSSDL